MILRLFLIRLCIAFIIAALVVKALEPHTGPGPVVDPNNPPGPAASAKMLMKYDANGKLRLPDKGSMVESAKFRDWLVAHHVDWRIVPSGEKFNSDQPEFKALDEQPRRSDNWMYLDNGRLRGKLSQELPPNEDAAEKLIGGYVR